MGAYNPRVSRFYSLDEANALLPEVIEVAHRLREQRTGLVALSDAWRVQAGEEAGLMPGASPADEDPELRLLRLRMRGIMDQMQADMAWMDERSIVLRDIETGLLDFPASAAGRAVWLCWRFGESSVGWWHGMEEGFTGRRSVDALPGASASA